MLYKKVDAASGNSISAALDLFSTPPTNCAASNSMWRIYSTLNPLNSKPFLFKIHPLTSMIDLSKIFVLTEMKIREVEVDGTVVDIHNEIVAPIQMPGATFIKNLKVLINQREIYNSNQLYSFKAYLDTQLSFSEAAKDSYFSCTGYASEENPISISDKGYVARKNLFTGSSTVQMIHKLDCDIFNQDLFLITGTELDIEISPQNDDFMLMQKMEDAGGVAKNYVLLVENISLLVKTVDLMDGLSLEIANKLDKEPARYAIRKTFIKQVFITAGRLDFHTALFTEEVPRRIIIGFVRNGYFVGSKYHTPLHFEHFDIRDIEVIANGRVYPQQNYNLDFDKKKYVRAYHDFQEYLGLANTNESNGISYKLYSQGFCFFVFMLTNAQEDSPGFELVKDGTTAVSIRFSTAVPAGGIQMLAYAEADGLILIDRNRTITSDLTV